MCLGKIRCRYEGYGENMENGDGGERVCCYFIGNLFFLILIVFCWFCLYFLIGKIGKVVCLFVMGCVVIG